MAISLHHYFDENFSVECLLVTGSNKFSKLPLCLFTWELFTFGRAKCSFPEFFLTVHCAWEFPGRCSFGSEISVSPVNYLYTYFYNLTINLEEFYYQFLIFDKFLTFFGTLLWSDKFYLIMSPLCLIFLFLIKLSNSPNNHY